MCLEVTVYDLVDLVKRSEDFLLLGNSPTSYLFTKSTKSYTVASKRINKASTHLPPFQIAPKHHRPNE
jgi:hypothetical protein